MHTLGKLGCFTFLQSIGLFFSIVTIFCNLNYIEEKTSVAILLAISCATVSLSVTLAWLFCHKETFKVMVFFIQDLTSFESILNS